MSWFSEHIGDPVVAALSGLATAIVGIFSSLLKDTQNALKEHSPEIQKLIRTVIVSQIKAQIGSNGSWDERFKTAVNTAKVDLAGQGIDVGIHLLATLGIAEVSNLRLGAPADEPLAKPPVSISGG